MAHKTGLTGASELTSHTKSKRNGGKFTWQLPKAKKWPLPAVCENRRGRRRKAHPQVLHCHHVEGGGCSGGGVQATTGAGYGRGEHGYDLFRDGESLADAVV